MHFNLLQQTQYCQKRGLYGFNSCDLVIKYFRIPSNVVVKISRLRQYLYVGGNFSRLISSNRRMLNLSYKIAGLILPVMLFGTTVFAFFIFSKLWGERLGYFFGFLFYWTFWCLLIPLCFITWGDIKTLFNFNWALFNQNKSLNIFCLVFPLVFAYSYAFPKALQTATAQIIIFSFLLAVINATMEEILWRGLYLRFFNADKWSYIIISSIGFAIWHFAPQIIFSNKAPGGRSSFVLFALVFGIVYSIVTFNTRSIVFVTFSHILLDFSGLGARIYLAKT